MGDADLVRRCRNNEARAWRELIRRYSPLVYRIGSRVLSAPDEAEDVSQETFMAAYRSLNTYDATRPFAPWIARIAYNNSLKRLRGPAGRERLASASERDLETLSGTGPTPEMNTIRAEEKAMVVEALERLAAQDRVLLDMRYREGLSSSEVSEVTGIPVNTVKTRIYRARGYLKTILAPLIKTVDSQ
jgi:RNA polymerase sigma-70 factor (ECF subfamily)